MLWCAKRAFAEHRRESWHQILKDKLCPLGRYDTEWSSGKGVGWTVFQTNGITGANVVGAGLRKCARFGELGQRVRAEEWPERRFKTGFGAGQPKSSMDVNL